MANSSLVILNLANVEEREKASPLDLMTRLVQVLTKLKSEFVTERGVDYARMRESSTFESYKTLATDLVWLTNLSMSMSMRERKSFFINLYNCLTLHALAHQSQLADSPLKQEGLWTKFAYQVGQHTLTLDDIEHGILRANRKHPSGKIAFAKDDPRLELTLDKCDARVHFALNCGARSCPPISIYRSEKLDSQLTLAAKSFCMEGVTVGSSTERPCLALSKLFEWYGFDFTMDDTVSIWRALKPYVRDEVAHFIELHDQGGPNDIHIEFMPYDWSLNKA